LVNTGEVKKNFLGVPIDKEYVVYTTNKPPETSLVDLGISLTGSTIVNVDYSESSMIARLLLEQILPLVFFIFLLVLAFKFF
jgi:positive regulator of sigma E activity